MKKRTSNDKSQGKIMLTDDKGKSVYVNLSNVFTIKTQLVDVDIGMDEIKAAVKELNKYAKSKGFKGDIRWSNPIYNQGMFEETMDNKTIELGYSPVKPEVINSNRYPITIKTFKDILDIKVQGSFITEPKLQGALVSSSKEGGIKVAHISDDINKAINDGKDSLHNPDMFNGEKEIIYNTIIIGGKQAIDDLSNILEAENERTRQRMLEAGNEEVQSKSLMQPLKNALKKLHF